MYFQNFKLQYNFLLLLLQRLVAAAEATVKNYKYDSLIKVSFILYIYIFYLCVKNLLIKDRYKVKTW